MIVKLTALWSVGPLGICLKKISTPKINMYPGES